MLTIKNMPSHSILNLSSLSFQSLDAIIQFFDVRNPIIVKDWWERPEPVSLQNPLHIIALTASIACKYLASVEWIRWGLLSSLTMFTLHWLFPQCSPKTVQFPQARNRPVQFLSEQGVEKACRHWSYNRSIGNDWSNRHYRVDLSYGCTGAFRRHSV